MGIIFSFLLFSSDASAPVPPPVSIDKKKISIILACHLVKSPLL